MTPEVMDEICLRLMDGETLSAICRDERMPARPTVHLWVLQDADFRKRYIAARDAQADTWVDETIDIADTTEEGTKTTTRGTGDKAVTETVTADMVEHRRLRVAARQWAAAKNAPKKYGDRIQAEHTGRDGGPIEISDVSLTDDERAEKIAAILDAARARKKDGTT